MNNNVDIINIDSYLINSFSADSFSVDVVRKELEEYYSQFLEVTEEFNRKSVSYQLSKGSQLHGWLKYKEGFSAELVELLLNKMSLEQQSIVLDPFLGSGTTSLVCKAKGINSIGFDILPISALAINVKKNVLKYNINEIENVIEDLDNLLVPEDYKEVVNFVTITENAYPEKTDNELSYIQYWMENTAYSFEIKELVKLCIVNSLERLSFTNKDGQYLRWDYRSEKVKIANEKRILSGKPCFKTILDKGDLPRAKETIIAEIKCLLSDICYIQNNTSEYSSEAKVEYSQNSALKQIPLLAEEQISGVITSPPYCNRYDYTRTYALELAFLGINNDQIKTLRQELLSCTVENKSKLELLEKHYTQIGQKIRYNYIKDTIQNNRALQEVMKSLNLRLTNGDLNNDGIIRMVEGYFTELGFVFGELYRVCKSGAKVCFVNDNVRYGGEVIPVDFLCTDLACSFGFVPEKIYCLKQQKGNSSQQMKKYGRVPLRKSITVWKKP